MAAYSLSKNGVAAASGAAYATIHSGTKPIKIVKFSVYLTTAVTSSIGIIRAANTPVATTSTLFQELGRNAGTGLTSFDTTWSTAPTITSLEYLSGIILPAAVSAGMVDGWRLDAPFELAAASWLVFWNFGGSTGAVPRFTIEIDE